MDAKNDSTNTGVCMFHSVVRGHHVLVLTPVIDEMLPMAQKIPASERNYAVAITKEGYIPQEYAYFSYCMAPSLAQSLFIKFNNSDTWCLNRL